MANVRRSARARGAATGKPTATHARQNSQPLIDLTNRGGAAQGSKRKGASEARGDGEGEAGARRRGRRRRRERGAGEGDEAGAESRE